MMIRYIHVFPNGRGEGKAMSMYLNINWDVKFKPFEKIYARAKLRVLNQRNLNNVERQRKQMTYVYRCLNIPSQRDD